jgi:hypothetical protein
MNRVDEFLAASLAVRVVDAKDECPAMLPREQVVVKRRPDVADVEAAGRRRCEPSDDRHFASPVWKKLLIG